MGRAGIHADTASGAALLHVCFSLTVNSYPPINAGGAAISATLTYFAVDYSSPQGLRFTEKTLSGISFSPFSSKKKACHPVTTPYIVY